MNSLAMYAMNCLVENLFSKVEMDPHKEEYLHLKKG
jgi:hypothetical protein